MNRRREKERAKENDRKIIENDGKIIANRMIERNAIMKRINHIIQPANDRHR